MEGTAVDNFSVQSSASSTSNETTKRKIANRKSVNKKEESAYKKIKFNNVDSVTTAVKTLQEIAQKADAPQPIADEFEAFGTIVAAHLRQLPMNIALESQSDIMHYLVQKRLGRRASFASTIPTQYSPFLSSPSPYPSPTSSPSPSCSYVIQEISNIIQPSTEKQQSTISEYETTDTLLKAWENIN